MWPSRSAFILFKYGTQNLIILKRCHWLLLPCTKKRGGNKNFSSLLGVQPAVVWSGTGLSFDFMGLPRKVAKVSMSKLTACTYMHVCTHTLELTLLNWISGVLEHWFNVPLYPSPHICTVLHLASIWANAGVSTSTCPITHEASLTELHKNQTVLLFEYSRRYVVDTLCVKQNLDG